MTRSLKSLVYYLILVEGIIKRHKWRTFFLILTIALGVMCFLVIPVVETQFQKQMEYRPNTNPSDIELFIQDTPENAIMDIKKLDNVESAEGFAVVKTNLQVLNKEFSTILYGIPDTYDLNKPIFIKVSEFSQVPFLDNEFAGWFFESIKSTSFNSRNFSILLSTPNGTLKFKSFNIAESNSMPPWNVGRTVTAFLPLNTVQNNYKINGINAIAIKLHDKTKIESTNREIKQLLHNRYSVSVISSSQSKQSLNPTEFDAYSKVFSWILQVLGWLLLLVGGIFIYKLQSISVVEDYKEIGIMKTIGLTRWHILSIYLIIGLIIGYNGFWIGMMLCNILIQEFQRFDIANFFVGVFFNLTLKYIFSMLKMITIYSIVCSIIPALRASNLTILESMNPGHTFAKKNILKNWSGKLQIPFGYSINDIFSNKKKTIDAIVIIAMSFALVITSISLYYAFHSDFNKFEKDTFNFNLSLEFDHPIDISQTQLYSEGLAEHVYKTYVDILNYKVLAYGILQNSKMYTYKVVKGRRIENRNEVVVSEFASKKLNLDVGDVVKISTISSEKLGKVVGIMYDPSVYSIIMDLSTLQNLNDDTGKMTNLLLKKSDENIINKVQSDIISKSQGLRIYSMSISTIMQQYSKIMFGIIPVTFCLMILLLITTINKNLSQRSKEFEILKVLGVMPLQIRIIASMESFVYGLFGSIFGTALSIIFLILIQNNISISSFYKLQVIFPEYILGLTLLTLFIAFITGYSTARIYSEAI